MRASLFRIVHTSVVRRAEKLNYNGNIPTELVSLSKENPTQEEINHDYGKLSSHFQHPIFSSWIPTYQESIDNQHLAWVQRYISK
jgi:hypothetical protein